VVAVFPGVPHQLCQFHFLREAAKPLYEADRHAKKELKKRVRGVRAIERRVETQPGAEAEVVRGYCSAVRSALTDDGRPPLEASGLKLQERWRRSTRAWVGRREKGAAHRIDVPEGDGVAGVDDHRGVVAADPSGVRVGASRGPHPGPGRVLGGPDPSATERITRGDDPTPGVGRITGIGADYSGR
jgi:hypothetical protein